MFPESAIVASKNRTMNTEQQLNTDILRMTMIIAELSPELMKYIQEIPVRLSYSVFPHEYINDLKDYYESLDDWMNKYEAYSRAIKF